MTVTIDKIKKAFNGKEVIDELSLSFENDDRICLFGGTGLGKSTLLNMIAGLIKPDEGSIKVTSGAKISFLFQDLRLLPWCNVLENILAVTSDKTLAINLLKEVDLWEHMKKLPEELSGGMCQRLAIARVIAHGGDVLLLDEPFKGLDHSMRDKMIAMLVEYTQRKLTIFVTHSTYEAAKLSKTIHVLGGPPLKLLLSTSDMESFVRAYQ